MINEKEISVEKMDEIAKSYCQGTPKPCARAPENCELRAYFRKRRLNVNYSCPIEEKPDEFTEHRYKALQGGILKKVLKK